MQPPLAYGSRAARFIVQEMTTNSYPAVFNCQYSSILEKGPIVTVLVFFSLSLLNYMDMLTLFDCIIFIFVTIPSQANDQNPTYRTDQESIKMLAR